MPQDKPCKTCAWWSHERKQTGYCYDSDQETEDNHSCGKWKASLRDEPLILPEIKGEYV